MTQAALIACEPIAIYSACVLSIIFNPWETYNGVVR